MKLRFIAMTGVMSLAGLGLIGAGAHAVWTTSTASTQTITAASMSVVLSGPAGTTETSNSADVCTSAANDCTAITLPSTSVTSSTYMTAPYLVTITNTGTIPINEVAIQLTDPANVINGQDQALDNETWACFYAPYVTGDLSTLSVYANVPMTTFEGWLQTVDYANLAPGATDYYYLVFYAGDANTGCGAQFEDVNTAGPFTYGGVTVPSAFWNSVPYPSFPVSPGDNSAASSLSNDSQGGTITPVLTFTYSA